METYLYFRKFRPATFTSTQGSATQALSAPSVASIGGAVDAAGVKIASATEIASMTVTPADGANSNIGSNYSHPGAGVALTLATSAINSVADSVITFDNVTQDTANGYNFETGDIITVTLQQGLETSVMYAASALKGIEASATGSTILRFNSLKNDGTDDVITIAHDNGKYEDIVNGINAIINGNNKGKAITVIDGSGGGLVLSPELGGLGIDGLSIVLESGY
tara:strand:+ start:1763 stop:2431 length:669 start_codon:yes stop_codon:yes gene_type:complete